MRCLDAADGSGSAAAGNGNKQKVQDSVTIGLNLLKERLNSRHGLGSIHNGIWPIAIEVGDDSERESDERIR